VGDDNKESGEWTPKGANDDAFETVGA
jgi:hypothetical protein